MSGRADRARMAPRRVLVRMPPGYTAADLEADIVAARDPMNAMLRAAGVRPPPVAAGDES
jgi:hypothetical protein